MVDLKNLEHIFFDLDDTIWDFERNSEEALRGLYNETELGKNIQSDFDTFLLAYKKRNTYLWILYHKNKITKEELRVNRFYDTFRDFGLDDMDFSVRFSDGYIHRSPFGVHLKKGTLPLLEKLKGNYQMHLITNGFKEVQHIKIKNCGLEDYFDKVLISEEVGFNKPDVRIFRHAEQACETSSESCLMIGDNFETDIVGAKNAGWQSVWFNPNFNKRYQTKQVNCLTELMEVF